MDHGHDVVGSRESLEAGTMQMDWWYSKSTGVLELRVLCKRAYLSVWTDRPCARFIGVQATMFPQHCCSAYVEGNDVQYGLNIGYCHLSTGAVIGLQCHLCIPLAYEEKMGPKRKPATAVQ
jgi:hypothetical protein